MTFALGTSSQAHLAGVHPDLVRVVQRAITISSQDFMVVEGLRTRGQMAENWGKGRTPAQCKAAGVPVTFAKPSLPKVTWLRDPYMSNHRQKSDGFGHAVDLGAWVDGKYDGNTVSRYDKIALAMFQAASLEKVHIRYGADWDQDGKYHEPGETDLGHFELV
jgi:peptidoglycan L-alanyl-D-glutamate endopeptidase CwlK